MKQSFRLISALAVVTACIVPSFAQFVDAWPGAGIFDGGIGQGADHATCIAVDRRGNTVVAGWSNQLIGGINIEVVKYSPAGAELFRNFYNGPAGLADAANAICVDNLGNVYVTGYSEWFNGIHDSLRDLVIVKWDSNLQFMWDRRYHSTVGVNKPDAEGVDIATDGDFVYVTGYQRELWSAPRKVVHW